MPKAARYMEPASDVSDFEDDLKDDDDDYNNGFRVADQLIPPRAQTWSALQLHNFIHQGLIDLNPPYQRDVVWTEPKQIGLIESIFRNFYIPPVIFAVHIDDDGEEVRICVDGKQRLTSILKFFDGQIPYKDPSSGKKYWFTTSPSGKGLEIPQSAKNFFQMKEITCVEYYNIDASTEREIFQRVQLGVTLTAAEKLQAISTPRAEWIAELQTRFVLSEEGLRDVIEWTTSRGSDFQCIAQLVFACAAMPAQSEPSPAKLTAWLSADDSPTPAFKQQISDVLAEMWHIAKTDSLNAVFTKVQQRVAPIEFVFIGILLFLMRKCSHQERAEAIYKMRVFVREKHRNAVRRNTAVTRSLWGYINALPTANFAGDSFSPDAAARAPRKRRRPTGNSDADSDGDYGAPLGRARMSSKRGR